MRGIVHALALALVATMVAAPAFAFPQINVIASETISTVPPRYKTTFTLELVGYNPPAAWYGLQLTSSGLGAPVTFYATECPAYPWSCSATPTLAWYSKDGGGLRGPATQFSVTTDQQVPCVEIRIPDMLLAKTPTPRVLNDYVIIGCLAVDMPTPATSTTWGGLKAIYR